MNERIIIAAVDTRWGISKEGKIPWHYPEDFAWFKRTTMGSVCVMGRNTYEDLLTYSLGKRPLPGRELHVVSSVKIPGVVTHRSVPRKIEANCPVFYIGGSRIFSEALEFCDKVILSAIDADYSCDNFFDYKKMESQPFLISDYISLSDKASVSIFKRTK